MVAVLMDLLVRPIKTPTGQVDTETLAVQARARGLDGVAVVGLDEAPSLGDTTGPLAATGVQLWAGVDLFTDRGRVVLYPRETAGWFEGSGWREAPHHESGGQQVYAYDALLPLCQAAGAALVAVPPPSTDGWQVPPGVSGVLVLGSSAQPELAEGLARHVQMQRLACVGGSDGGPGDERFGRAATVFAAPPTGQLSLVEALRSGRAWPVEIGAVLAREAPQRAAAVAPADGGGHIAKPVREDQPRAAEQGKAKPAKKTPSRYDVAERPGDNRGNRLNREEVLRALWLPSNLQQDELQPSNDPIAVMYGLEGRKQQRYRDKSDVELDRLVNGNRAKGSDPNIMAMPNFDEMRHDRVQIHLLFAPSEEKHDLEDSIALRFALSHVRRAEDGTLMLQGNPLDRGRSQRAARHQHQRRRR